MTARPLAAPPSGRERLRGHLIYLLVLIAAVSVQVLLVYARPATADIPIYTLVDRDILNSAYPTSSAALTWTLPESELYLAGLGSNSRFQLDLITAGHPPELSGRMVQVLVDGVPAASFVTSSDPLTTTLEFGTSWWGDARVTLSAEEGFVAGDVRPYGVALGRIKVTALPGGLVAVSQLVAGLLIAVSLYLLFAALGANRAICGVAGTLAGLVFAYSLSGDRLLTATIGRTLLFPAGAVALVVATAIWLINYLRNSPPAGPDNGRS